MNSNATAVLGKIKTKTKANIGRKKASVKTKPSILYLKISLILLIVGLFGVASWRIAKAYDGKILPKVTVAGINVGGKTPKEAKYLIDNYITKINTSGPEITYSDQTVKPKLDEMGVSFNTDKTVLDAYNVGRKGTFTDKVKYNAQMLIKPYNVTLSPQIDEGKFDGYLSQLAQVVEKAPVNAGLVISNGEIQTTPPETGRGIDKDKLKNDLNNIINNKQYNSKIALVTSDLVPAVLEPGTVDARAKAEKYMQSAPIVVTFEGQSYTATKAEVGSWIDFPASGNKLDAVVSGSKVGGFAGYIASQIEIPMIDKEVMDGTGQVLNEGQDGRGVDTDKLIAELKERVESEKTGSAIGVGTYGIAKGLVTINPHAQPGRYPGRYIDINLSEQTLYAFEGFNLVNQFLVSTGKTGPTPTGEFHVYGKDRVTRMSGPGYDLPGVEWVSWFSGDYSIHGTYWHNNFGHPMSHGCVNASNGNAEWVYNWDEVGTPVYIHW